MHDPNILFGCEAQLSWLRRETGDGRGATTSRHRAMATARPEILLVQAVLASDAAEAGHVDVARGQLDRLAADGLRRRPARQWMTVMALGQPRVGGRHRRRPRPRAGRCAGCCEPYDGQMAVIGTGVYVLGAIDRLLAGLAALEGDHDAADALFAAALDLGAGGALAARWRPARRTGGAGRASAAATARARGRC